jgi:hypothetical protein
VASEEVGLATVGWDAAVPPVHVYSKGEEEPFATKIPGTPPVLMVESVPVKIVVPPAVAV